MSLVFSLITAVLISLLTTSTRYVSAYLILSNIGKELHPLKAFPPMLVTLLGMLMEVKLEQPEKVPYPMLVTPWPRVTEVKPEHPKKAYDPMLVTLLGMLMEVRLEQPLKAPSPMLVTPWPRVTEVKPEHPLKAYDPMLVTLLGMVRSVIFSSFKYRLWA